MKYIIPSDTDCLNLLTEEEYDACLNERIALQRGRNKAWAAHCAQGPTAKLRDLACGSIGDSILLTEYRRSGQVSALIAPVSLAEGVQFTCTLERSLVTGEIAGVRVTLVAFTR